MGATRDKAAFLRNYPFKIEPGVKVEFGIRGTVLRVINSAVPVYFESRDGSSSFYLEQGEEIVFTEENIFYQLDIYHMSGAEQSIVIAVGENARIGSAKVSGVISGTVELGAGSLAALESINVQNIVTMVNAGQAYGASFGSTANLAAAGTVQVFSPASNVNGAIVHASSVFSFGTTPTIWGLIAKNAVPASAVDGDVILSADNHALISGNHSMNASLKNPIRIPAGKGLYFFATNAEGAASKSVLYTLL